MIRRTISYKESKIILCVYKTLVRQHAEYGIARVFGTLNTGRTENC